jgi:hypothetical protein
MIIVLLFLFSTLDSAYASQTQKISSIKTIGIPFRDIGHFVKIKDKIYTPVNSTSAGMQDQIIAYDIKRDKFEVIYKCATTKKVINGFNYDNGNFVWAESDEDGGNPKVVVYNLKTHISKVVYSDTGVRLILLPDIYKDQVSLLIADKQDNVYCALINKNTNKVKLLSKINTYGTYNFEVSAREGKLMWTDSKNDSDYGYFYLYDFKTGLIKKVKSPDFYVGYGRFSGNYAIGMTFLDHRVWNTGKLGYINLKNQKFKYLTQTPVDRSDIKDSIVAYGIQNRIYYYDINSNKKAEIMKYSKNPVYSVQFAEDGTLMVGSYKKDGFMQIELITFK